MSNHNDMTSFLPEDKISDFVPKNSNDKVEVKNVGQNNILFDCADYKAS